MTQRKFYFRSGRNQSSDDLQVSDNANAVFKSFKKKDIRKILMTPFYFSGMLSCLLVLFIFIFMTVSCKKLTPRILSDDSEEGRNTETIELSDYSLTTCRWNYANFMRDTLYLINSQEEFLPFISCDGNDTLAPSIDFDQYSLLLVYGTTTYGYKNIIKTLQRQSVRKKELTLAFNQYMLNVEIILDMTAIAPGWVVAVLTPKLPQDVIVILNKVEHF